jgi:hypothetical protein
MTALGTIPCPQGHCFVGVIGSAPAAGVLVLMK